MDLGRPSGRTTEDALRQIGTSRTDSAPGTEGEMALCYRWRDRHDIAAVSHLASSHLPLVRKIASHHLACGLPMEELVSEGQLGLMRALCRFDPDSGICLSGYAIGWIRAAIQEHISRSRARV
jgi:RNA polymerase sigma-32 factor